MDRLLTAVVFIKKGCPGGLDIVLWLLNSSKLWSANGRIGRIPVDPLQRNDSRHRPPLHRPWPPMHHLLAAVGKKSVVAVGLFVKALP
ncbi:MAG TPA: hypothetical protein PLX89_06770 [Verrucomicrobiota bacterium]|nr:hypothetical protein [Verrucomicrobiales bacterium]HRI12693.1 hypothetical protein [Verrucomicrobiota bacterium]